MFRAPVRFDEETAALVFPARWLDHRIAGADAVLHARLAERIAELEAMLEVDFRDALRRILRSRLLSRDCSAGNIADLFSIHRRTLNRRLNAEGPAFGSSSRRCGSRSHARCWSAPACRSRKSQRHSRSQKRVRLHVRSGDGQARPQPRGGPIVVGVSPAVGAEGTTHLRVPSGWDGRRPMTLSRPALFRSTTDPDLSMVLLRSSLLPFVAELPWHGCLSW